MEIRLVELESLFAEIEDLGDKEFAERYPGAFMVAMGFLAGEEVIGGPASPQQETGPVAPESDGPGSGENDPLVIEPSRPRRSKPDSSLSRRLDYTAAFKFGQRVQHDPTQSHPLAGLAFFLRLTDEAPNLTIGRSADCDITVPERSVSEEHCRIEVTPQGVIVVDNDSTNGTLINQVRLGAQRPVPLANEDILTVGRYSFQLLSAASLYQVLQEIRGVSS